jgi:hypothetical protein
MIPVDREIDTDGTSYERAADAVDTDRALIEQTEHDEFVVLLPIYSEGAHRVQYRRSRFGNRDRVASCDCAHHQHRGQHTGQPCAHILAIALADERSTTTARDRPIRPYQRTDADDLTDDTEADVESTVDVETDEPLPNFETTVETGEPVSDGGRRRYAAGADSEIFGRPEDLL